MEFVRGLMNMRTGLLSIVERDDNAETGTIHDFK